MLYGLSHKVLKHNIYLYRLLSIFGFPFFWQPVLYLFFTQIHNISATSALSLISFYSLGVVLLEVPSGAVADHVSRKLSATLGYSLKGIGFLSLTFVLGYPLLLISMLIVALGESLTSGSLESLMYDSVKQSKNVSPKYFKHIFASSRTILHFSLAIFIFIGGFIGKYNLTLPIQLSSMGYLIAGYLSSRLIEPESSGNKHSYMQHIINAGKLIFSSTGVQIGLTQLLIANFFFLGLISSMFWLTTPLLSSLGISIFWIGILTASTRILKSFASHLVSKYDDPNDFRTMLITGVIMGTIFLIASIFTNVVVMVLVLFLLYLVQSFYQANNMQLLNDLIGDLDRTTLNSFQSMFTRLYEFSVIPIVGVFLDKSQIPQALSFNSALLFTGCSILYFNRKKFSTNITKIY